MAIGWVTEVLPRSERLGPTKHDIQSPYQCFGGACCSSMLFYTYCISPLLLEKHRGTRTRTLCIYFICRSYCFSKEVDIGLSSYTPSWQRAPLLETMSPLIFHPIVMAYRKPEVTEDYGMPLGPLDSALAAGVVGTLVLVSVLVWILEMSFWAVSVETEDNACCSSHLKWRTRLLLLDTVFQITGGAILAERKMLTSDENKVWKKQAQLLHYKKRRLLSKTVYNLRGTCSLV